MLRTSHQRMVLCRSCPLAKVADLVGDSVTLIILRDLLKKPRRFTGLQLALAGVSSRTLTLKLKKLEKCGIVSRHPDFRLGNKVVYRLTKKGAAWGGAAAAGRGKEKNFL